MATGRRLADQSNGRCVHGFHRQGIDPRHIRHDGRGTLAGRAVFRRVGGAEQSQRWRAGRGGQVHQPGIVADEQCGAAQDRRHLRQGEPADQVDRIGQQSEQWCRQAAFHFAGAGQDHRYGARQRSASQRGEQRGEAVGRPGLRLPVRGRRQYHDGPVRRQQRGGARLVFRRGPHHRLRRWIDAEHRSKLRGLVPRAAAHHRAAPRRHDPGQHGTADVHHQVPALRHRRGPKRQPMPAMGLLPQHDGAVAPRHAREHVLGHRAARHGEARQRMGAQQVIEQAGGQHRVAQPVGGDEQDFHAREPHTSLAAAARGGV